MFVTKQYNLFISILYHVCIVIHCNVIDDYNEYFSCDTEECKTYSKLWLLNKRAVENAIETDIVYHSQAKIMNVFEKKRYISGKDPDIFDVIGGFLNDDGMTTVLFRHLKIPDFPKLYNPNVEFPLPTHYFKLKADLYPFFWYSTFLNFRNSTNVVYKNVNEFDPLKESPFSLPGVPPAGAVTVEVFGCQLNVYAIIKSYEKVATLSHVDVRLSDCHMTLEIGDLTKTGLPPVVAPYFSEPAVKNLENILATALQTPLTTLLQTSVFSFVNMTSTFYNHLDSYSERQEEIFKNHNIFMEKVVEATNKIMDESEGAMELNDYEIYCETGEAMETKINIMDVKLYGMNTGVATLTGGPYLTIEAGTARVMDGIKYKSLQVAGTMSAVAGGFTKYNFSVEIRDLIMTVYYPEAVDVSPSVPFWIGNVRWSFKDSEEKESLVMMNKLAGSQLIAGYIYKEIQGTWREQMVNAMESAIKSVSSGPNDDNKRPRRRR